MTPEDEKNYHTLLFSAAILFIVLGGFAIILLFGKDVLWNTAEKTSGNGLNTGTITAPVKAANVILVKDQPLRSVVNISTARLTEPGFILLRRESVSGTPFTVVGASNFLEAGTYKDININFYTGKERPNIVSGDSFFAVIVKDNGDKLFNEADLKNEAKNANGKIVAAKFTVF